jgi:hypothetical protein
VGKPLVDKSTVSWKHDKDSLDLSDFVKTVDGSEDKFTLKSALKIDNPSIQYAGNFSCTVKDSDWIISQSVKVLINGEYSDIA